MLFTLRCFLAFLCLSLCALSASAQNLPSIQRILNKGKLVVAVHAFDLPPMYAVNAQGQLVGHEIELAHYLGKQLGVPVEFVRTAKTFDEVIDLISNGKADIGISGLTPNLTRAKKVFFTTPYLHLKQVLIYNRLLSAKAKLTDPPNQLRTLKNIKIGILNGSVKANNAKQYFPDATLVTYPTLVSALPDLEQGKLSGFFDDAINVYYWLKQDSNAQLYLGAGPIQNSIEPIAIAVSGKYPDLLPWLNLALELRRLYHADDKFQKEYIKATGVK